MTSILTQGCTISTAISGCYEISLTLNLTKQLDPNFPTSPRQRLKFRTGSHPAESTFKFVWKRFLSADVRTSTRFFHMMQVFDKANGSVITLNPVEGQVEISDIAGGLCPTAGCPA